MKALGSIACLGGLLLASLPAAVAHAELPDFEDAVAPPAPDYADVSSWAATLDAPGMAAIVPKGAIPAAEDAPVDVFYIHPTTFRSRNEWNQKMDDELTNAWTDVSTIARQASVFNACCRVFAPRYRQASFNDKNGGRDKALALAYEDISAAFDYFLEHFSKGRPFIIAGHSQGGYLVAELLEKKINGTPLADRMVAAYGIGMAVAEGEAKLRFPEIPICNSPDQTGCYLQWNALRADSDIDAMADRSEAYFVNRYGDMPGKQIVCVNPISFTGGEDLAPADQSKGAVPGSPGVGPVLPIVAGKVSARCVRGQLAVEFDPALDLSELPGGALHYHDFGLFYEDVRENAIVRVNSFLAQD